MSKKRDKRVKRALHRLNGQQQEEQRKPKSWAANRAAKRLRHKQALKERKLSEDA